MELLLSFLTCSFVGMVLTEPQGNKINNLTDVRIHFPHSEQKILSFCLHTSTELQ